MRKISVMIMVIAVMITSLSPSFADNLSPSSSFDTKRDYLAERGVEPFGVITKDLENIDVARYNMAQIASSLMSLTDSNWKAPSASYTLLLKDTVTDKYIQTVIANGIMRPTTEFTFSGSKSVTIRDFLTVTLRALGYGNNDNFSEFNWFNSAETAIAVGIISQSQYNSMKDKPAVTWGDAATIMTNVMNQYDSTKNPYTDEYLKKLIDANPVSAKMTTFRNASGKPAGFDKISYKYIDVYYHKSDASKACISLLNEHCDKVYAMLQNLYGVQPAFDIYLLDSSDLNDDMSSKGPVFKNDQTTYLVLNEFEDVNDGNLVELVDTMNVVFFSNVGIFPKRYAFTIETLPWMVRANCQTIESMYAKNNYKGDIKKLDMWNMYDMPTIRMSFREWRYTNDMIIDYDGIYTLNRRQELYYFSKWFAIKSQSQYAGCLGKDSIVYKDYENSPFELQKMNALEIDKYFALHNKLY